MLKPKKQFSQNFLVDQKAKTRVLLGMSKLCDLADSNNVLPIVEVGPGAGDLTTEILNWKRQVIALELDSEAIDFLSKEFIRDNFELFQCDAMKVIESGQIINQFKDLPNNFVLLSALPYQVGSRILVDLAVRYPHVSFACIHQKEVVKKTIVGENFCFFGAWLNLFWKIDQKFDLAPHCFNPQPKVYSTFFTGESKNLQSYQLFSTIESRQKAKYVLKKLFSFPSKTLSNNLKTLDWSKEKIEEFLSSNFDNQKHTRLDWNNYKTVLEKILEQIN